MALNYGGETTSKRNSAGSTQHDDEEEERLKEYEVIKRIGAGRFGEVFLIRHISSNEMLCWKVVPYKGLREIEKKQLVSEVNVMRDLNHPNIVRYYDRIVAKKMQSLYIVMEYCEAGDLAMNIATAKKHFNGVEEKVIIEVAKQLCNALAYCHSAKAGPNGDKVLHRDLKPQNIFLTRRKAKTSSGYPNFVAKLGDFGLSRSLGMMSFAHTCVGTPYYWSPELLQDGRKMYDDKSDIWALGCVLYEMASGNTPFANAQNMQQLKLEVKRGPRFPIQRISSELNNLIRELLRKSPTSRPSAQQCLGFTMFYEVPTLRTNTKHLQNTINNWKSPALANPPNPSETDGISYASHSDKLKPTSATVYSSVDTWNSGKSTSSCSDTNTLATPTKMEALEIANGMYEPNGRDKSGIMPITSAGESKMVVAFTPKQSASYISTNHELLEGLENLNLNEAHQTATVPVMKTMAQRYIGSYSKERDAMKRDKSLTQNVYTNKFTNTAKLTEASASSSSLLPSHLHARMSAVKDTVSTVSSGYTARLSYPYTPQRSASTASDKLLSAHYTPHSTPYQNYLYDLALCHRNEEGMPSAADTDSQKRSFEKDWPATAFHENRVKGIGVHACMDAADNRSRFTVASERYLEDEVGNVLCAPNGHLLKNKTADSVLGYPFSNVVNPLCYPTPKSKMLSDKAPAAIRPTPNVPISSPPNSHFYEPSFRRITPSPPRRIEANTSYELSPFTHANDAASHGQFNEKPEHYTSDVHSRNSMQSRGVYGSRRDSLSSHRFTSPSHLNQLYQATTSDFKAYNTHALPSNRLFPPKNGLSREVAYDSLGRGVYGYVPSSATKSSNVDRGGGRPSASSSSAFSFTSATPPHEKCSHERDAAYGSARGSAYSSYAAYFEQPTSFSFARNSHLQPHRRSLTPPSRYSKLDMTPLPTSPSLKSRDMALLKRAASPIPLTHTRSTQVKLSSRPSSESVNVSSVQNATSRRLNEAKAEPFSAASASTHSPRGAERSPQFTDTHARSHYGKEALHWNLPRTPPQNEQAVLSPAVFSSDWLYAGDPQRSQTPVRLPRHTIGSISVANRKSALSHPFHAKDTKNVDFQNYKTPSMYEFLHVAQALHRS